MNFLKNLRNKISPKDFRDKALKSSGIKNPSLNYLFRELTYKEKNAVEIYDYRNVSEGKPNNNVLLCCEHASNE